MGRSLGASVVLPQTADVLSLDLVEGDGDHNHNTRVSRVVAPCAEACRAAATMDGEES